jgi:hypothetical protein
LKKIQFILSKLFNNDVTKTAFVRNWNLEVQDKIVVIWPINNQFRNRVSIDSLDMFFGEVGVE